LLSRDQEERTRGGIIKGDRWGNNKGGKGEG